MKLQTKTVHELGKTNRARKSAHETQLEISVRMVWNKRSRHIQGLELCIDTDEIGYSCAPTREGIEKQKRTQKGNRINSAP